ncbi:hypothetical protein TFUB20_00306 [Tannerella forsythia]|uniref:Uncharacterized protein n=1 Tax=Tannerella forsythia TaxID=28112 RepID=A0A1D3UE09_TANFO|nr:hypothetical protein TFUB20_00306 [Tannerella forsythia]
MERVLSSPYSFNLKNFAQSFSKESERYEQSILLLCNKDTNHSTNIHPH